MSDMRERGDLRNDMTENYYPQMQGNRSFGFVDMAGASIEDETITVGGRIYEFSADGAALTTGDVRIDVSGGLGAANAAAAFVSAINGDDYAYFTASLLLDNIVALYADSNGTLAITLAEATTNMVVSAAAMVGGMVEAEVQIQYGTYTITAADVTTLGNVGGTANIGLGFATFESTPVLVGFLIRDSNNHVRSDDLISGAVAVAWALVTGSVYELTIDDVGGATPLAAGDIITWCAIG
jgi:hypothetical protein